MVPDRTQSGPCVDSTTICHVQRAQALRAGRPTSVHRGVWFHRSYNARERSQCSLRSDLVRINVLKSSASGPRACGPAAKLGLHDCPVMSFRTCATRDVGLSSLSSANCLRSYRLSVCPPFRVPLSTSSYTRFVYVVLVNHNGCIVWEPCTPQVQWL